MAWLPEKRKARAKIPAPWLLRRGYLMIYRIVEVKANLRTGIAAAAGTDTEALFSPLRRAC